MMEYLFYFFIVSYGFSLMSCVHGWTYHNSSYNMTYDEAQIYCRKHYTDMVAIQNRRENEYLNDKLKFNPSYYWIGIRRNNITGEWFWVGTKKVLTNESKNWAKNEPNNKSENKNEDCVEMYVKRTTDSGKWNDEPCNKKKVALCYKASCHSASCNSHGECIETINDYTCSCYEGFYGTDCEHAVTCPEVKGIDHGSVVCTHVNRNFTYQTSCSFTCSEGHKLVGAENLQCTSKGDWGSHIPHCKVIQCERPEELENGVMKCSNNGEMLPDKSTCNFSCDEGFTLVGSLSILCVTTGQWTERSPKCEAIQCEHPEKPENGEIKCSNDGEILPHKAMCNFSCDEGFIMVGSPSILCLTPGQWTEKSPKCKAIECKQPEKPLNGTISCTSSGEMLPHKSTCNFKCSEGFRLIGHSSIICEIPGQWNGEIPKCEAVQCASLVTPENGVVECQEGSNYNSTCAFFCAEGFQMVGSSKLQCLLSGEWTSSVPICKAVQCATLTVPENSQMKCQDTANYNSQCAFSCSKGFRLIGSSILKCLSSGKWTLAVPKCEAIKCDALVAPFMGNINCTHPLGEFEYGSICKIDCEYDLLLNGTNTLKCDSNGNWTSTLPSCEVKIMPYESATYLTVGVLTTGASVLSTASLLIWLIKRLRKTAHKFTPSSSYQHLEATGVYQTTEDRSGSV
ncbi:E-selectin-like [Mixophyes fleayi]|uniref:E-selectin-like n=1 Tax=Mixophyes fleayi TaxID=3061075 RepID=UPI003F4DB391